MARHVERQRDNCDFRGQLQRERGRLSGTSSIPIGCFGWHRLRSGGFGIQWRKPAKWRLFAHGHIYVFEWCAGCSDTDRGGIPVAIHADGDAHDRYRYVDGNNEQHGDRFFRYEFPGRTSFRHEYGRGGSSDLLHVGDWIQFGLDQLWQWTFLARGYRRDHLIGIGAMDRDLEPG